MQDKKIEQDSDVVFDKKKEIKRLNKLLAQRHPFTQEKFAEIENMLFDGFFRATCWLNIQMLTGNTRGTGAYATVIEKLHFVLRDVATRRGVTTQGTCDNHIVIGYECELPAPKDEVEA